ncbi:AAEL017247-PA [Aedes aegypti]|uniref:AAEL017247-PA n=1 Tax=Aedes aegypti TaxID=7159 RepID=J9HFI3_AEDAE|nr:AAEL017247-PA [Aedes aegypti]
MPIDHFCMRISCGRYEDTLCPGKSRKFPTRKDPRPVGFEPTTLSLVLLNNCAFTATAIWAPY